MEVKKIKIKGGKENIMFNDDYELKKAYTKWLIEKRYHEQNPELECNLKIFVDNCQSEHVLAVMCLGIIFS